jgi:hypothetical protein
MTRNPPTSGPVSTGRDCIVLADHQQDLARLVGADRRVRNQQRVGRAAVGQAHVAEHARRQEIIGVGHHRAGADRARVLADAIVGEVEPALPIIGGLVLQADFGDLTGRASRLARTRRLEEQGFRHVEREIERIERVDRGQQRLVGADDIAGVDAAVGDPPADRRPDMGELDIQRA